MSLSFQTIHIHDKALFEKHLQNLGRVCDHAFANLFAWQAIFGNQWAECHDRLIVRSRPTPHENPKYMILPDIRSQHLPDILQQIQEDADAHPYRLVQLSEEEKQHLERLFPDTFLFDNPYNMADYMYEADDFRTFKGRRLAAKRNHVNKFKSLYPYQYKPLTSDLFGECMRLERQWRTEQHGHNEQLDQEETAIRTFFNHYDDLGLNGGALFVEDTLAAFTFGSPINDHTFDIHIEKADTRFEGVFPMVSQLFAQHLPSQYTLINREEDLGLPGLRQSKLSYHPLQIVAKYSAQPLDDDLRGIIRLWRDCFHENTADIHSFLSRYYTPEHAFLRRANGSVIAQCMFLPCDSEAGRIGYLYAIATAERWRRQGLAANVVEDAIAYARAQGLYAVALIPASAELQDYYARFGFVPHCFPLRFTSDYDLGTGDLSKDFPMILKLQETDFPEGDLICTPEEQ